MSEVIPELVVHQETGILVPPEDPEKLRLQLIICLIMKNQEEILPIMLLNLLIRILAGMFY